MNHFLGIDGGGTRTTASIADADGRVIGRGVAGPSNPLKSSFPRAQREILRAARAAAGSARIRLDEMDAVCLGLAGAGHEAVRKRMSAWLRKAIPSRVRRVTTDAEIALTAAFGHGPGIILIAGTGSNAYARDERGRIERAGGWGSFFDDAGSGYEIGKKAITAALRAEDGRSKPTVLGPLTVRALGLGDISDVILSPPASERMAALFVVVLKAARRGDPVARELIQSAGVDLAELVKALVRRLAWRRKSFTVACTGGVLENSPLIRSTVARLVRSIAPKARVIPLRRKPVEGALTLARALAAQRGQQPTRKRPAKNMSRFPRQTAASGREPETALTDFSADEATASAS